MNIAFDLGGALQGDRLGTDGSRDLAAYHHLLTGDQARYLALLADDHFGGLHVALDLTVDLQNAAADDAQPLADDTQIVADDRFITTLRRPRTPLRTIDHRRGGRSRRARLGKRVGLGRRVTRKHEDPPDQRLCNEDQQQEMVKLCRFGAIGYCATRRWHHNLGGIRRAANVRRARASQRSRPHRWRVEPMGPASARESLGPPAILTTHSNSALRLDA